MAATPTFIDDPADERLADYRAVRERDLVGRRGLFVAEGRVVLSALLRSPAFEAISILVSQAKAPGLADLLAEHPTEAPIYVASQPVMDAIVGFAIHRGVLAVGRRRAPEPSPNMLLASLPERALVLACCGIGNHDNVGALFRNAAAFGVDAVLLDDQCCDPLYRKALRVSVGAGLLIPWAQGGADTEVLKALQAAGFEALAFSPGGAQTLEQIGPSARMALLVGAEGPGLSPAVLAHAKTVRIPMAAGFNSLNVATAAAIALSRLAERR